MFEEALFESAGHTRRSHPSTLLGFVLQCAAITAVVVAPLLHIEPPPQFRTLLTAVSFAPPPPPAAPPNVGAQAPHTGFSQTIGISVVQPPRIPAHPAIINDENVPPPSLVGSANGVAGGTGSSTGHNISDLLSGPIVTPLPPAPTRPVPVSTGVMQGLLLASVRPVYPALAQAAGIQGAVVLNATISREGTIENLRVESGHPMLVGAAIEAVRQWRYRAYLLNGRPIEVETQITVNFVISGR